MAVVFLRAVTELKIFVPPSASLPLIYIDKYLIKLTLIIVHFNYLQIIFCCFRQTIPLFLVFIKKLK
jgi:hypothetical protein